MQRLSLHGGLLVALGIASLTGTARADLIAGWDFQTTATGGTAVIAYNSTTFPKVYNANVGAGAIYLDGTNGSSNWDLTASSTTTELNAFAGTAINAGTGMSTVTTSPAALALVNQTANGKDAIFKFSMAGYSNLAVSYAAQRTATGFNSEQWDYSTDGTGWTALTTVTTIPSAFAAITLPTTTGLDNAANAYLRLTLTGCSSASGNNRFDNIQFNADKSAPAVPEPGTVGLLASGLLPLAGLFRRRK